MAPDAELEYAAAFDYRVCPQINNATPITDQMVLKLDNILSSFTANWNQDNQNFWKVIYETLNKNYPDRELKASLTLCSSFPGAIAYPLMINASPFIRTQAPPLYLLTNLIFHEMLHIFLINHYPSTNPPLFNTPLLIKYSNENMVVKMHLHLFSLQYSVYKSLAREKELIDFIQRTADPDFARAWTIVQNEEVQSFIEELKERN